MAGPLSDCSRRPAIWLAPPAEPPLTMPAPWLTGAEQKTVARAGASRQQEYLHSRWLLRQALAHASDLAPAQCQPVPGRPTASLTPPGWRLSLSHCPQLAACATGKREVGVDIEPLGRRSNWQGIVRRWFTQTEQSWLLTADTKEAARQFLIVWTLKEAWLKATGRGIANNLQTLEVSADLQLRGDAAEPDWHAAVGTVNGFMMALVYRAETLQKPLCSWLETPSASFSDTAPAMAMTSVQSAAVDWVTLSTIDTEAQL